MKPNDERTLCCNPHHLRQSNDRPTLNPAWLATEAILATAPGVKCMIWDISDVICNSGRLPGRSAASISIAPKLTPAIYIAEQAIGGARLALNVAMAYLQDSKVGRP